ncbi:hypothetical protein GCM10010937_14270 [Gluconobacter japonicus]|uniref:Uncharacterized protein n=1 Tax=Gluconobacter japonicus TaxID=376620 RepID=A0ABQ5WIS7_GLUJA|nr:hypothetical protein AD938_00645 [Gluconobacter japonicus]GLQ59624.1 hypothetical protein GCM10010937_14270 [Gluconobacter japonicus]
MKSLRCVLNCSALDGCFLDRPVHPFNPTIGPGGVGFCQTVFNSVGFADHVEAYWTRPRRIAIAGLFSELDSIVGQDGVDPVRDDAQEMFEEFSGRLPIGFPDQLCDSEFAGSVDSNEEVQLFNRAASNPSVSMRGWIASQSFVSSRDRLAGICVTR